jgi:plasmid stabilization system protein ParE
MTYRIVLSEQASCELDAAADWWAEHRNREQARRWYAGFSDKLWTLCQHPDRLSLADENDDFPYTIRELHYGLSSRPTHRAVFTVVGDNVLVLTVRHAAQGRITPEDISEPMGDD